MGKKKTKKSDEVEIPVKWIYTGFVIIVLVALYFVFGNLIVNNKISQADAEQKLLNFFETEIPTSQVQVVESSRQGDFYEFIVLLDGQQVPFYITLDGKYMTVDLIPLE